MCQHCDFLSKVFPQFPTEREIDIYKEMFVYLHNGNDYCKRELDMNKIEILYLKDIVNEINTPLG